MAKRVRKLARELRGTAGEVLGLLHDMGFERYRSPEDMLPSAAVDKVRRAWKKGRRGRPARAPRAHRSPSGAQPEPDDGQDLMAQLVPGVVPQDDRRPAPTGSAPEQVDLDAPVEALAGGTGGEEARRQAELREALERDRDALEQTRARLEQARRDLDRAREELAERERAHESERQALQQARAALAEERRAVEAPRDHGPPGLEEVLAERGLRGVDEFERALGALASSRRLRELVPLLEAADAHALRGLLDEVLVLVGGSIPTALPHDVVGVRVAPDRAEMPGWDDLGRSLGKAGERLMLHGLRRVVVVGGRPGWQRLLREGIDERVELRFQAGDVVQVGGSDRIDAAIFWGRVPSDAERQRLREARCIPIVAPDDSVGALCRAVVDTLDDN